jgi:archaeal flagellin FlaB
MRILIRIKQALNNLNRNQKGMTGLETAIIMIAFVTIASVLAYSVLSAGIFAAERGKETIYKGLEQAQNTLKIKGSVLGLSSNSSKLESVQFAVGLVIPTDKIDSSAIVVNYWDDVNHIEGLTYTIALAEGSAERGIASMIEGDESFTVTISIPGEADLTAYKQFNIEIIPPTGGSLALSRSVPGSLWQTMDLH